MNIPYRDSRFSTRRAPSYALAPTHSEPLCLTVLDRMVLRPAPGRGLQAYRHAWYHPSHPLPPITALAYNALNS